MRKKRGFGIGLTALVWLSVLGAGAQENYKGDITVKQDFSTTFCPYHSDRPAEETTSSGQCDRDQGPEYPARGIARLWRSRERKKQANKWL